MGVRVRSTQTKGATAGLAAGTDARGKAEGVGAPAAKDEKGAGAFSARARRRAPTATLEPEGRQEEPNSSAAFEDGTDSASKRGRQRWKAVVRRYGGPSRLQEGKRDGA